jgi:RNA polymerase sigma-70 factor (ECF subfamily)
MGDFPGQLIALTPRLRRYARGLTGDAASADDLVQDTLERALRFRWRFRWTLGRAGQADGLVPWLLTLMHRVQLNAVRRSGVVETMEEPPDVAAPDADTGLRHDLLRALQALPEAQRAVLLLVAVEQLSYQEAAGVLDIPVGTVMSRLARAREQMRVLLSGERMADDNADSGSALRRVK